MQQTKRVKNPRKQRKRLFNAPAHIRRKLMSAPLSAELASSRGTKSMPVRKGDTVRILRGDNKGFEGKVSRVDRKAFRIYVEGLTREKVDGTNIFLPIHPSKVQIRNLNLDDKWRKDVLARKKETAKAEKQSSKEAEAKEKAEETEEAVEVDAVGENAEEQPEEAAETKRASASKKKPAKEESLEGKEETPEETKEEE